MSLFELLIVVIVGFLVTKPEDFPIIISKLKEIRSFITDIKKEIASNLDSITELRQSSSKHTSIKLNEEMEQMNFYLEKISNLGIDYKGDYSLSAVKSYYRKVIQDKIKKNYDSSVQNKK